jgi:hypothetical protein
VKRVREFPLDRWAIPSHRKEALAWWSGTTSGGKRWISQERHWRSSSRPTPCSIGSEGKASSTISWYDDKLHEFLRWLENRGYEPDLGEFTVDRVREFVLHLQGREDKYERNPFVPTRREKLSSHTIQGHVRVLKAFASWLCQEGYTDDNVLQRYRLPKNSSRR